VAPILYKGSTSRKVYLPEGAKWKDVNNGQILTGGQWINYDAPLEIIPVFLKNDADIL
jgi:alpha-D-xyloside xylohydrolase